MDEFTSAAHQLICCVSSLNGASREILFSAHFHWLRGEHARQVVMGPISRPAAFPCKVVPPGGRRCCQTCWCCFGTGTFSFGIHRSGQAAGEDASTEASGAPSFSVLCCVLLTRIIVSFPPPVHLINTKEHHLKKEESTWNVCLKTCGTCLSPGFGSPASTRAASQSHCGQFERRGVEGGQWRRYGSVIAPICRCLLWCIANIVVWLPIDFSSRCSQLCAVCVCVFKHKNLSLSFSSHIIVSSSQTKCKKL